MQKACSLGRHQFTRVRVQHSKISHKGQLCVEKKKSIILESVKQALCVRLWQEFGLFVLSWTITK